MFQSAYSDQKLKPIPIEELNNDLVAQTEEFILYPENIGLSPKRILIIEFTVGFLDGMNYGSSAGNMMFGQGNAHLVNYMNAPFDNAVDSLYQEFVNGLISQGIEVLNKKDVVKNRTLDSLRGLDKDILKTYFVHEGGGFLEVPPQYIFKLYPAEGLKVTQGGQDNLIIKSYNAYPDENLSAIRNLIVEKNLDAVIAVHLLVGINKENKFVVFKSVDGGSDFIQLFTLNGNELVINKIQIKKAFSIPEVKFYGKKVGPYVGPKDFAEYIDDLEPIVSNLSKITSARMTK